MVKDWTPDYAAAAMVKGLEVAIKSNLKALLMKVAEEEVDAAVQATVAKLEISLKDELNYITGDRFLKVLLMDKRMKE